MAKFSPANQGQPINKVTFTVTLGLFVSIIGGLHKNTSMIASHPLQATEPVQLFPNGVRPTQVISYSLIARRIPDMCYHGGWNSTILTSIEGKGLNF